MRDILDSLNGRRRHWRSALGWLKRGETRGHVRWRNGGRARWLCGACASFSGYDHGWHLCVTEYVRLCVDAYVYGFVSREGARNVRASARSRGTTERGYRRRRISSTVSLKAAAALSIASSRVSPSSTSRKMYRAILSTVRTKIASLVYANRTGYQVMIYA